MESINKLQTKTIVKYTVIVLVTVIIFKLIFFIILTVLIEIATLLKITPPERFTSSLRKLI